MTNQALLSEIEAFLSETDMGPSYFGKVAVGNSELVKRLRLGRRVWPETADMVRDFIAGNSPNDAPSTGLARSEASCLTENVGTPTASVKAGGAA